MTKNDGGPAFPVDMQQQSFQGSITPAWSSSGMTLRDYFAAKAINGFIQGSFANGYLTMEDIANQCYKLADAMLNERNNGQ